MFHSKRMKLLGFAAAMLCAAGPGCGDDDNNSSVSDSAVDDGDNAADIQSTCEDYCAKAHTCDDSKTVEQCVADCKADLGDCMADEQSKVLDDLDACADKACNDFTGCTIGAGLQCTFGI